jgi:eukaryotic-like serine/threonine-protein kinase
VEALRLAPRDLVYTANLMFSYIDLDRFDEAKAVAERAFTQKLDSLTIHVGLLRIAYVRDDHAAQEKEIQWFAGNPDEYRSLSDQAASALMHGQRHKAKEFLERAVEIARRQGVTDFQPGPPSAVIDALMGDCEAARQEKSNPALALCGDPAALRLAEEQAAKNLPPNPDTAEALYQRGLAGLAVGKGAEAAAEFQTILDHKGRNWGPRYSLAYLGLARASVLAGDTAKAKRAYQDFLALWKDADPDIPILISARKEYAVLH